MNRIDWKEIFGNKATLIAFITALLMFIYRFVEVCGFEIPVAMETVVELVELAVVPLVMLGIVTNSNTPGIGK